MERDGITEEAAGRRIDSQLSNKARVDKAHVILSTLWQPEETQKQVLHTTYMVVLFLLPCLGGEGLGVTGNPFVKILKYNSNNSMKGYKNLNGLTK